MFYEGINEYICSEGHYSVEDIYYSSGFCSVCNKSAVFCCSVDYTNGYEEDNPQTHYGTKEEISYDDVWKIDHYGNKYALKLKKYKPINGPGLNEWKKL